MAPLQSPHPGAGRRRRRTTPQELGGGASACWPPSWPAGAPGPWKSDSADQGRAMGGARWTQGAPGHPQTHRAACPHLVVLCPRPHGGRGRQDGSACRRRAMRRGGDLALRPSGPGQGGGGLHDRAVKHDGSASGEAGGRHRGWRELGCRRRGGGRGKQARGRSWRRWQRDPIVGWEGGLLSGRCQARRERHGAGRQRWHARERQGPRIFVVVSRGRPRPPRPARRQWVVALVRPDFVPA